MGKILLYLILFVLSFLVFFSPFYGACAYYLLAILGPQYIWWWVFGTLRVSFFVGALTGISIIFRLISGKVDSSLLFTKLNLFVFLLWLSIAISYFLGPYVNIPAYKVQDPDVLFINSIKIFIFYLFANLVLDDTKKIKLFSLVMVVSVLYLSYWANMQYFNQNWAAFNWGRLQGPISIYGGSIYKDENVFAMLFVTGIPFIAALPFIFQDKFKSIFIKLLAWMPIVFAVHAIFLTASRGGLIGLGMIAFCSFFFIKRKFLAIVFVFLLAFFYVWQAGDVMKQRSDTIQEYKQESSAEQRIKAWKGGLKMILKYPFTGVGLGSFITALPDFYPTNPRVAHNTFIQFTAESGLLAGFSYLMIIFFFYKNAFKVRKILLNSTNNSDIYFLNVANSISFTGLIACSLFLSLNFYEVFFYLLLINNSLAVITEREYTKSQNNEI